MKRLSGVAGLQANSNDHLVPHPALSPTVEQAIVHKCHTGVAGVGPVQVGGEHGCQHLPRFRLHDTHSGAPFVTRAILEQEEIAIFALEGDLPDVPTRL